jgi:hypothetical protein
MTFWILTLVLFGFFGSVGSQQGGIRMSISMFGVVLGAFLSMRLDHHLYPVLNAVGVPNLIWKTLAAPLVVFVVIATVFLVTAQFVHQKVEFHFKWKADDENRYAWERLSAKLGICVGTLMAAVHLVLIGSGINYAGYCVRVMRSPGEKSTAVNLLVKAHGDLISTGIGRMAARYDPAPPVMYDIADIVGMVYQNPSLWNRLAEYPGLLSMGQRAEIDTAKKDPAFAGMLTNQAPILDIINHPSTQTILNSQEVMNELRAVSAKDLENFLKTGKSSQFADEKLLGCWLPDIHGTLMELRRSDPARTLPTINLLRTLMAGVFDDLVLLVASDKQTYLKGSVKDAKTIAQIMAARPLPGANRLPFAANTPGIKTEFKLLGQGNWAKQGDKYQISLGEAGTSNTEIKSGRIQVVVQGATLVFVKDE